VTQVGVIDLGTGNLFSVLRGLERAGGEPVLLRTREEVAGADRLVLPGVGSFADASARARSLGLGPVLRDAAARGKPLLGICLGMQLLFEQGEEDGISEGLGLLPGRVVKLKGGPGLAIPHVGWQRLTVHRTERVLPGATARPWFYFSHSYRAVTEASVVAATVTHGEEIPAVVARGSVFGIQPHPEKSGSAGLGFLSDFLSLQPSSGRSS
jgi:glutamine amidotransferase